MKPPAFRYHDPRTVADVVGLLSRLENAKLLAGGQSLMPMLNMRFVLPDDVIDLNRVEGLSYIREEGGALEVAAMTRQRDLEFSELVKVRCPIIHKAIRHVGHRQTRNRGTLGGSLCHLDPAAELVTLAAALDASVGVVGPNGRREIPFDDFPAGYMATVLAPDELLVSVRLPLWEPGHGYAFVEYARRHGDFAIVSAAVLLAKDRAGKIVRASLTLGGIGIAPLRMTEAERALSGNQASPQLFEYVAELCRRVEITDDPLAPASYRRHLAAVLSRRALEQADVRVSAQTRS